MENDEKSFAVAVVALVLFIITSLAAWGTHVVHCFRAGEWGFLIAGAIAVPVAWIHGVGLWLGVW